MTIYTLLRFPEGSTPEPREIEKLFKPILLSEKVDGKPLELKKEHGDETAYGKVVFAEKIVRAKASSIDFSDFHDLLDRIEHCIKHYETIRAATSAPSVPVAVAASSS